MSRSERQIQSAEFAFYQSADDIIFHTYTLNSWFWLDILAISTAKEAIHIDKLIQIQHFNYKRKVKRNNSISDQVIKCKIKGLRSEATKKNSQWWDLIIR